MQPIQKGNRKYWISFILDQEHKEINVGVKKIRGIITQSLEKHQYHHKNQGD